MMLAFTDVDTDEDIDDVMLLEFLHRNCDWGRESCRAWLAKASIIEAGR